MVQTLSTSHPTSPKKKPRLTAPILVNSAEVEVIRALRRQGRISRTEISNITGWSKAKASQEIRSLVDKGYLVEFGEGVSQGGRKPRLLRINNELGYIAGIDIGATSMDIALADVTGSILERQSEPTDVKLSPEAVLGRCSELLLELVQAQGATPAQILGIGVIGTGIGAGIISNGKLHRGSDGSAGDIGHICVDKDGPLCACGNKGCLEAMTAGPAIMSKAMEAARNGSSLTLSQIRESKGGIIRPEDVNAACREGDQAALDIIRESGQMIGDVLASLVNFFNPSHIFIGGGIANFGNHLLVAIRRAVLHRSLPLATTHLSIKFSRIGSNAGIVGAISLALDYLFAMEDNPHLIV